MATARKLPSGSYRVRAFIGTENGKKKYKSFTAETKKEAERLALEYTDSREEYSNSIASLIDVYVESKINSLSPTTLIGYKSIRKNLMNDILDIKIKDINSANIQSWVGNVSKNHAPKTVKNAYGLLTAALDSVEFDKKLKIKLPQANKIKHYVPTDSDIKRLMDFLVEYDTDMYIACNIAAFGTLRRSEICALTVDDVNGNILIINKAMVKTIDNNWIIKTPKNTSSNREVKMPQFVIDMLPKQGQLVNINPSRVSDRFIKYLKKLNMRYFRFHDLRHYSASIMHAIGVPDVYIMERGGWSSDDTLKKIYRGSMNDYSNKYTNKTNKHFSKVYDTKYDTKK